MLGQFDASPTLPVKDLARARRFYEQMLGLAPEGDSEMGVQAYRAGGVALTVYESEFAGTNQGTAVTWPVGDRFDAVVAALRGKGVAFETYDMPGITVEDGVHRAGDMKLAWFKDPDGNIHHVGSF
jgi:catechol 2,3-dioxygenase-like lactoylglutathione lyase family enzyme